MSVWPNEVTQLFAAAVPVDITNTTHAEKIKAHINRLWLAGTPEEAIVYEIFILAAEAKPCAD